MYRAFGVGIAMSDPAGPNVRRVTTICAALAHLLATAAGVTFHALEGVPQRSSAPGLLVLGQIGGYFTAARLICNSRDCRAAGAA
jgi:hypothetical protein